VSQRPQQRGAVESVFRPLAVHGTTARHASLAYLLHTTIGHRGGSVAEWLACWTQAQKGPGSNRSRITVLGKLFTPIVPLFTKQQNW